MSSEHRGSLYLLPNTLGNVAPEAVIPAGALDRARSLDYIIAEDPKAARAFLKRIAPTRPLQSSRVERPYRNDRTLATMLRALAPATLVCIAADLTLESEMVRTQSVAAWRRQSPQLKGRPTVFLLLAE